MGSVRVAAVIQLLTAATFLIMPFLAYRYGDEAQRAAEKDAAAQGFRPELLEEHGVRFRERGAELLLPLGIALVLVVLAVLNLAGSDIGRIATFVFQPLLLIGGGFVTAGQVFAVRFVEAGFRKSGEPELQRIEVRSVADAAVRAFPLWFRPLVVTRFVLATAGSALVILLLATA